MLRGALDEVFGHIQESATREFGVITLFNGDSSRPDGGLAQRVGGRQGEEGDKKIEELNKMFEDPEYFQKNPDALFRLTDRRHLMAHEVHH